MLPRSTSLMRSTTSSDRKTIIASHALRAPLSTHALCKRFGAHPDWSLCILDRLECLVGSVILRRDHNVRFENRPVTEGLPNTVIFQYDVAGVTADSFFIQQSWDDRRRARISPQHQTFTSTCYEPAYFNAKLIADSTVLREHPVHVTTDDWLALVEHDPVPIFLDDVHQPEMGYLSVSEPLLRERGIDTGDEEQIVSFYNLRTFDSPHTDRFTLETTVRHGMNDGRYPCRRTEIYIIGERSALGFMVGIPGCVGDLAAWICVPEIIGRHVPA